MALNGRLESIPLGEVLRMLARSRKTGCLRVEASGVDGKIFLNDGRLIYATTRRDDDLRADLLNAGFVDPEHWQLIERRERSIAEVLQGGTTTEDLRDFLAEQGTEVIFRLTRTGRGTFDFGDDVAPRYDAGESVDIEICLGDAEHRAAQWAEIEEVIPGTKFRVSMVHALPEGAREVTLTADTWRLLTALAGQGTIEEVAQRLGSSEFSVAKAMASLVRQDLLAVVDQLKEARYSYNDPVGDDISVGSQVASAGHDPDALLYEDDEEADGGTSDEDAADLLQSVLSGVMADAAADEAGDDLEIVSSAYDADDELEGSLSERAAGLMRRRGLGAAAKDISESD